MYPTVSQRWSSVMITRMFGWTSNGAALVTVPSAVTTETAALSAPDGTVAVSCASESTVNVAGTVPNDTSVVLDKPVPEIVTVAPNGAMRWGHRDRPRLRMRKRGNRNHQQARQQGRSGIAHQPAPTPHAPMLSGS